MLGMGPVYVSAFVLLWVLERQSSLKSTLTAEVSRFCGEREAAAQLASRRRPADLERTGQVHGRRYFRASGAPALVARAAAQSEAAVAQ